MRVGESGGERCLPGETFVILLLVVESSTIHSDSSPDHQHCLTFLLMQNPLFLLLRVILEVLSFLAMAMGMFKLELSRGESDVLRSSFRECTRVFRPPTSGFGGKCASSEPIPSLRRSIVVEVPLLLLVVVVVVVVLLAVVMIVIVIVVSCQCCLLLSM